MTKKNVPPRLWDFGLEWICETGNLVVSSSKYAKGRTPIKHTTGETPDISKYLDFSFYDWVIFRQNAGLGEASIGRWLGVSHRVGQLMSFWILPVSGVPISCVTVQALTTVEQNTKEWQDRMIDYDSRIKESLQLKNLPLLPYNKRSKGDTQLSLEQDKELLEEYSKVIDSEDIPE